MILIKLSEDNFEYDVQSLVRAFFKGEEIVVRKSLFDAKYEIDKNANIVIVVDYKPYNINIAIYEKKSSKKFGIELKGTVLTYQDDINVDYSNRPDTKNRLKRLLYTILSRKQQIELPWGTLTGIRPVKIPLLKLEEKENEEDIKKFMQDTYFISDKKANLSIEIAKKELKIIEPLDYKNGYSIYIGIPFCPSTCAYCSFTSYPIKKYETKVIEYLDAVKKELEYISISFKNKRLNTIYIGGGTPTTLSPENLSILFNYINKYFDVTKLDEFTIEAGRPDSITEEKLKVIKDNHITRISINPQTMHDKTLKLIGRRHSVEQFKEAYELARSMGFNNINTDLILGLPDETFDDVKYTFENIFKLNPEDITVHSLAIKRAARLNIFKEQYDNCHFENNPEIMEWVINECRNHGYEPYYLYRQKNMTNNLENIGFSKPGKEGIYNILIMEEKQTIAGVGAGAITKFVFASDNVKKADNVKDVDLYINEIDLMIKRKNDFLKNHITKMVNETDIVNELPYHIVHGINVSNLAYEIAKEYGLNEEQCYELAIAGMLHDIGKLALYRYIDNSITGSMNIEKIKYMRMHSKLSYDILKSMDYSEFILESILYHHESFDGTGFPNHLSGDEIPIGARILRVCDVFTALLSKRAYRDAFDIKTAKTLMIEESQGYDIEVFLAFLRVLHRMDMKKITLSKEDIGGNTNGAE